MGWDARDGDRWRGYIWYRYVVGKQEGVGVSDDAAVPWIQKRTLTSKRELISMMKLDDAVDRV